MVWKSQKGHLTAISMAIALFISASPTLATEVMNTAVSGWRIQNYPTGIKIFFTGSPCTYGELSLDSTDTLDRHKQLLATVLAAKSMNAHMQMEYDVVGAQCILRTFAVDGP
jgi:hypothetical protein